MKLKQRNVCQTCRARKLGCDGKQPDCGQCLIRGRQCQWDTAAFTFISQKPVQEDGNHTLAKSHWTAGLSTEPPSTIANSYSRDQVELIITAFIPPEEHPSDSEGLNNVPRICGAWVAVLPQLVRAGDGSDRVLPLAVAAFSSCLTSKRDTGSLQIYNAALEAVRTDLSPGRRTLDATLIAAVMCLTLTEVFISDSGFGSSIHMFGIAQCFQAAGPHQFQSGMLHTLFTGFRPLLLLESLRSRKASFLALPEWTEIPFSSRHPSVMQRLISHAAPLPSLLQRSDSLLKSPSEPKIDELQDLCDSYLQCLSGLELWETAHQQNNPASMWNRFRPNQEAGVSSEKQIWFSNITMANSYTHLWAFRIICAEELDTLIRSIFSMDQDPSTYVPSRYSNERMETLAVLICCSMDYLLQEDLKLFGSTSAMLPLHIACNVLVKDELKNAPYISRIRQAVDRMVEQGIQSAPSQIYS